MKGGRAPKCALKSALTEKFPDEFNPLGAGAVSLVCLLVTYAFRSSSTLCCDDTAGEHLVIERKINIILNCQISSCESWIPTLTVCHSCKLDCFSFLATNCTPPTLIAECAGPLSFDYVFHSNLRESPLILTFQLQQYKVKVLDGKPSILIFIKYSCIYRRPHFGS